MSGGDSWPVKYRPQQLRDVIGQEDAVTSISRIFDGSGAPVHVFLFTGPSGVGKTTFARLVGHYLDIEDITEIDGATNRGIDAMRAIASSAQFPSFTMSRKRLIIIDECHELTKEAWDSLLKITEEPPDHLYWCFCTTVPTKLPKTLKTRAVTYALSALSWEECRDVIDIIDKEERLDIDPIILDTCARLAEGSARQAIQNLVLCLDCTNVEDARDLISQESKSSAAIDLARYLSDRRNCEWPQLIKTIKSITVNAKETPEGVRLVVLSYVSSVVLGTVDGKPLADVRRVAHLLSVMEQFAKPFYDAEKWTPLILACARIVFEHDPER